MPTVQELRVELAAEATSASSVEFRFKFVKAYLNRLFGLPIFRVFGRPLPLVFPVPGTLCAFLTIAELAESGD